MPDTPSLNPKHSVHEDAQSGVVRVAVSGFFDIPTLEVHFAQLRIIVRRLRSQSRPIRTLVDAVHMLPHAPPAQKYVESQNAAIYRDGDKLAVLVSSSLVKMQMRRAFTDKALMEFFISERAALLWLEAEGTSKG